MPVHSLSRSAVTQQVAPRAVVAMPSVRGVMVPVRRDVVALHDRRASVVAHGFSRVSVPNQELVLEHPVLDISTPAIEWTYLHNLGYYPAVTVVNHLGEQVYPDITYVSEDEIRIIHGVALAGKAYLSN